MNKEEMQTRLDTVPEGQVFTIEDITGGEHDPGLWMHLCHMDDGKHIRADGCLFAANRTRTEFYWIRPDPS